MQGTPSLPLAGDCMADVGWVEGRASLSGRRRLVPEARAGVTFSAPPPRAMRDKGIAGEPSKAGMGGVLLNSGRKVVLFVGVAESVFTVSVRSRKGVEGGLVEVVDLFLNCRALPVGRLALLLALLELNIPAWVHC